MNNAANEDDIRNGTAYATMIKINVVPPRWGFSKSGYFYDTDRRTIAKGVSSIKYMNDEVADALYDLAHQNTYDRFIDLLYDIDKKTSLNTRQLDILIKLDFFADFGNQRELLKITELFYDLFKKGDVKKLSKEKIDGTPLEPIVRDYAVGVTKAGGVAKSYTVLDVRSIMRETEDVVKAAGMQDLSDVLKIQHATEVMGYMGYVSGKEEDRKKLYLLDVYELHRKSDGRKFGYNFRAKSIGSGKENNFTVLTKVYERNPVMKGDIIYCKSWDRNNRGYFSINDYERVW